MPTLTKLALALAATIGLRGTEMADSKRVDGGSGGLGGIVQIAELLGGQQSSSTTTSDTSALQGVLQQLQAQDPAAGLATLFQQVQGAVPQFQQKFSNAVGARSGGNSAVSAALQKLLQEATVAAAKQTADARAQNLSTQANVAGQISQGNKTTKATQGTNLQKAGTMLGILQLASKSGLFGDNPMGKVKELFSGLTSNGVAAPLSGGGMTSGDLGGGYSISADAPFSLDGAGGSYLMGGADFSSSIGDALGGFNISDFGGDFFNDTATSFLPEMGYDFGGDALSGISLGDELFGDIGADLSGSIFGWADGGLVGRDKPQGYADGGLAGTPMRAGGSRRSANPNINLLSPTPAGVQTASQLYAPQRMGRRLPPGALMQGEFEMPGGGPATNASAEATAESAAVGNAIGSAVSNAVIGMTLGPVANTAMSALGINPTQSALSQVIGMIANALGSGSAGGVAADPNGNPNEGLDGMDQGSATGTIGGQNANTGSDTGDAPDGPGDTAGSAGNGTGASTGDGVGGYKSGGMVEGKGTGTSDSINAFLSDGEYVVPADVTAVPGVVDFLDFLRKAYHQPVANSSGAK